MNLAVDLSIKPKRLIVWKVVVADVIGILCDLIDRQTGGILFCLFGSAGDPYMANATCS